MQTPPLHERLVFETSRGQVMDGDRRYVLMRADVLMGVFGLLPDPLRSQALASLTASVFKYGSASVRAYADPTDPDSSKLFAAVATGASSLGWGVWEFSIHERSWELTVLNSPFAAASDMRRPACAAIVGMLRAVCEHAWQAACIAEEVDCCAVASSNDGQGQTCRFRAVAL